MQAMELQGTLLMFDVDGVVTDEHARVDAELIAELRRLCDAAAQLAFITGRSRRWLEHQLWPELQAAGFERDSMSMRFAAEMGALRRGRTSDFRWQVSSQYAVPDELRNRLRSLPERRGLSHLIEWDPTKEATSTFESLHRPEESGFAARARDALVEVFEEARALAEQFGCRAAMSTYALDILAPTLTKRVGAEFTLSDIENASSPERIYVFGDSPGDMAMAETARDLTDARVRFVWVGKGNAPRSEVIEVHQPPEPHARGTLRALRSLLHDAP